MDWQDQKDFDELAAEVRALKQSQMIRDAIAENVAAFIKNPSANNWHLLTAKMAAWQEWHQQQERI